MNAAMREPRRRYASVREVSGPSLFTVAAVIVLAFCLVGIAAAQTKGPVSNAKVKIVPVPPVSPGDAALLFETYCVSCHGKDGRGLGPASRFSRERPADLTRISASHPKKEDCVLYVINALATHPVPAGNRGVKEQQLDMPDWESILRRASSSQGEFLLRKFNLARHVASLQPVQ